MNLVKFSFAVWLVSTVGATLVLSTYKDPLTFAGYLTGIGMGASATYILYRDYRRERRENRREQNPPNFTSK